MSPQKIELTTELVSGRTKKANLIRGWIGPTETV
jgi:hypothetical protein